VKKYKDMNKVEKEIYNDSFYEGVSVALKMGGGASLAELEGIDLEEYREFLLRTSDHDELLHYTEIETDL